MNTNSQIVIVGANFCPVERLDHEIVENDLFKQDWRSRKKKVEIFQYIVLKWTFDTCSSYWLVGFFDNLAVENIAGFKLLLTSNLMLEHSTGNLAAFFAYGGINVILAMAAAALCAYVAPAAAGSGIPEVKAYLNGVDAYS